MLWCESKRTVEQELFAGRNLSCGLDEDGKGRDRDGSPLAAVDCGVGQGFDELVLP